MNNFKDYQLLSVYGVLSGYAGSQGDLYRRPYNFNVRLFKEPHRAMYGSFKDFVGLQVARKRL